MLFSFYTVFSRCSASEFSSINSGFLLILERCKKLYLIWQADVLKKLYQLLPRDIYLAGQLHAEKHSQGYQQNREIYCRCRFDKSPEC
jgi:hypothetical protein